jgi:FAD synthase
VAQHRELGDEKVSSTVVRNVIAEGDMEHAARLLGARYMLSGVAKNGVMADVDEYKMLPPSGEYACSVDCADVTAATTIKICGRTATIATPVSGPVIVIF